LHPLSSAAVSAAFPRGHTALNFVDVGVGFADRAAVVVAVGFSQDLWLLEFIYLNLLLDSRHEEQSPNRIEANIVRNYTTKYKPSSRIFQSRLQKNV
jgi:hypothetical protein